ncbi:lysylphosphatidylglycerol synthase domain-containing protein [Formosa haliotis]|uniref:lysylphosphatidylglycerol synthase domain-containing protein n=1 Tax=Formosa haliotis TaxID=1555194 RepID=UPI000824855E|nr:lysylphosphatidylglycerol synthase domain-containing protein [Formosa haliotis]
MYAKALTYKSNQFLTYLLKLSIIGSSFYFIYYKLSQTDGLSLIDFSALLASSTTTFNVVFGLVLLTILNWFFEILKWKTLVNTVCEITLTTAAKQILGAHTASLFTPNRIGDYGAKALYFTKPYRTRILGLNGVGNVAQMLITTFFGCLGLLFFTSEFPLNISFRVLHWSNYVVLSVLILGLFILMKMYLKPERWMPKIKNFFKSMSLKLFGITLLLSFIRYVIFSFQFYVLLQMFQVDITYLKAMMLISSMYVLASILPSIFIFDVVLKGSIAVYLFSFFNINEVVVLSCILLMWILNTVLPSVIGSYFVLNFKLPKA